MDKSEKVLHKPLGLTCVFMDNHAWKISSLKCEATCAICCLVVVFFSFWISQRNSLRQWLTRFISTMNVENSCENIPSRCDAFIWLKSIGTANIVKSIFIASTKNDLLLYISIQLCIHIVPENTGSFRIFHVLRIHERNLINKNRNTSFAIPKSSELPRTGEP